MGKNLGDFESMKKMFSVFCENSTNFLNFARNSGEFAKIISKISNNSEKFKLNVLKIFYL